MRDGNDAAFEVDQQIFQPSNRIQVEVVGRLVQQQHIWARDQGLRERDAFAHAARKRLHHCAGIQLQSLQSFVQPLLPTPALSGFNQTLQRIQIAAAVGVIVNPLHDIG